MLQEIMEQKLDPLYPIGFRIQKGDWTLHYCKAGAVGIDVPQRGAGNDNRPLGALGIAGHNAVAGAYTLDIKEVDMAQPTVTYTAKDIYKDGYLLIFGVTNGGSDPSKHELHRIKRNDVGNGTYVRLYLFDQIQHSQDAPTINAWPNIYGNVVMDYPNIPTGKMGVVCVPLIVVSPNYHFWGLTWGPMSTTPHSEIPGAADSRRQVYFKLPGGCIILGNEIDFTDQALQLAGFALPNNQYGGSGFFMLQIAP